MTYTSKHLTVAGERALRVDFRAAFRVWRKMTPARRLAALQCIRDFASLDEGTGGADVEVAANIVEALHTACERKVKR